MVRPRTYQATDLLAGEGLWPTVDDAFETLWQEAQAVQGWLSEGQARILYRAATCVPPGRRIVEIGSHHGRSTVFLAAAKSSKVPMLAVDPFDNPRWGGGPGAYAAFCATLDRFGLTENVETFRGVSIDASAEWSSGPNIGLILIDGAHDRASVIADVDGWEHQVAYGGIVMFHDAFSSIGVTRALTERHLFGRQFRCIGTHRSLIVLRREALGSVGQLRSMSRFAAGYPYFARNLAIKLSLRRGWSGPPKLLKYRPGDDLF